VLVLSFAVGTGCGAPQTPVKPGATAAVRHPYRELPLGDWANPPDEDNDLDPMVPPFDPLHGAGKADQVAARFRGTDRKGPKTSLVDGAEPEAFASVAALQEQLRADGEMMQHDPAITRQSMERVTEEQRMVRVAAWIYAIKYEDDNDWHLITGTDPDAGDAHYLNAEVAGLPARTAPAYPTLLAARQCLARVLDDDLPGPGKYRRYDPPIGIALEGALFYDIDHAPGVVGPAGMRPTTAWEVHPVTSLGACEGR
jgi:hypothetical protein